MICGFLFFLSLSHRVIQYPWHVLIPDYTPVYGWGSSFDCLFWLTLFKLWHSLTFVYASICTYLILRSLLSSFFLLINRFTLPSTISYLLFYNTYYSIYVIGNSSYVYLFVLCIFFRPFCGIVGFLLLVNIIRVHFCLLYTPVIAINSHSHYSLSLFACTSYVTYSLPSLTLTAPTTYPFYTLIYYLFIFYFFSPIYQYLHLTRFLYIIIF